MRTIIEVPDEKIKRLDTLASREKLSRAAVIREAITLYLDQKPEGAEHEAFGVLKDQPIDALAYEKRLRSEWDDRG